MDKKIEKTRRFSARHLVTVLVIALLIYLAWLFLPQKTGSHTILASSLITSKAKIAKFEDYIPLRVSIEPLKTVFLDAIEGGRVEAIFVEEGAYVEQGQALLKLSNTALQLDLISREAQVSEQLNNLRNTKLAIERYRLTIKRELMDVDYQITLAAKKLARRKNMQDVLSEEALQRLQDEIDYLHARKALIIESQGQEEQLRQEQITQLQTSVKQLEQNLDIARANLENLLVKAPRSGQLTSFDIELGESRARGERLGQIDDITNFKASGFVSEFYLHRLALGQQAIAELNGHQYTLSLSKIYPKIINREFEVDLVFVGTSPDNIRRGQTLTPKLALSESSETLLIDNGAFMQQTGGKWIYVIEDGSNTAVRRAIKIGRQTPSQVEILAGLKVNERVIVSNYKNYPDADNLQIKDE
ncbi:efflux RND transporter periplasmic adaptor subunit [Agaribacter flavus]|uniref:Efflux RND transporter periplasmic adaptor subunit n=1 Tax=Agaribacter flavus TaxID=1902781 RepID=A0ABV7FXX9_9ALTE